MSKLKIAIGLFGLENFSDGDPSSYLEAAKLADKKGIDYITITDHVVMGERTDKYPFGDFPVPYEYPWFEPLTVLSGVAAVTNSIKLSTGVVIAPLRSAVLLAKICATLDVISKGRLEIGVGTGWQKEEYDASNIEFDNRLSVLKEQLEVCKELWSNVPAKFSGKHISFESIYSVPLPKQKGGVPFWFGIAANESNADLIAKFGLGWIPIQPNPKFISRGVNIIKEGFLRAKKDPEKLRVRGQLQMGFDRNGKPCINKTLESLEEGLKAGITDLEVFPSVFIENLDQLPDLFDNLIKLKS
ncbi:MAG: TIGR03619 family F420-dependent LLM class oxidoreductase [SAR86 cluster bacterium]|nr:TIGR03619 family F420-dependent LLM class oxidoreductase [SAR86 cluster bacterium]